MMAKWKDETNGGEIVASRATLGGFRLDVYRHIQHRADAWLASCNGLFEMRRVGNGSLDEAKEKALIELVIILDEALSDIKRD